MLVDRSTVEEEDIPNPDDIEVRVNSLVWITSLRAKEVGVRERDLEDLVPYLKRLGIGFALFEPASRDELYAFLSTLRTKAKGSFRPIIHLDMHGDADDGIHIVKTGENAPWATLVGHFREINVATNNSLCVISLACFGFHILKALDMNKPTPFYALVGSERQITAGEIEQRTLEFYKTVFETQDLATACKDVWDEPP